LARSLTNSFAGIDPANVLAFVLAQCVGATVGYCVSRWLWTDEA
jgi:glycerol uptake facilitator-like aquaporin